MGKYCNVRCAPIGYTGGHFGQVILAAPSMFVAFRMNINFKCLGYTATNSVIVSFIVSPWPVWLSGLSGQPVNQKVTGLIPSQGKCLGCGPSSQ